MMWPYYVPLTAYITPEQEHIPAGELAIRRGAGVEASDGHAGRVDEFLINLSFNLQAEGVGLDVISKIMQEYHDIGFAKTASKKVLGSMNQIALSGKCGSK